MQTRKSKEKRCSNKLSFEFLCLSHHTHAYTHTHTQVVNSIIELGGALLGVAKYKKTKELLEAAVPITTELQVQQHALSPCSLCLSPLLSAFSSAFSSSLSLPLPLPLPLSLSLSVFSLFLSAFFSLLAFLSLPLYCADDFTVT